MSDQWNHAAQKTSGGKNTANIKSMRIMLYLLILPFFNNLFLTQALYLCASVTKDLD